MFNLNVKTNERSIMKAVPMDLLDTIREALDNSGTQYRIVYRGPRSVSVGDTRPQTLRQSSCLKRFATHFAVYPKKV